jgi:DNA polymerase-3 subunit delta'
MMNDIQQSMAWLQPSWTQLSNYIDQNRIPQALLIIGNKGLGKQQLAEYFSQSLMCSSPLSEGGYCGKCQSCTLFQAKTHPDYIFIAPEETGKVIGIDVVRQLTVKLSLKPQYESYRLVVINPADSLNNASANAFLKYLEEPTERTCLILITDRPSKLPATIRSRCQKLLVSVSDEAAVKTWLTQQGVVEDVDLLLKVSQGSPLLAKRLSEGSALNIRADCFKQWQKVAKLEDNFVIIAEQWNKLDKAVMDLLLIWLISWVGDLIKIGHHLQAVDIVNLDLKTSLQEMVEKLDLKKLYKHYDFLLLSRQRLDTQLNKQLMIEEILIQWSELNGG